MTCKTLPLFIVLSLIALGAQAQDKNPQPFYLKMDLGNSTPADSFRHLQGEDYEGGKVSSTWLAGIGVGYSFNKNIRADVALTHRDQYKFRSSETIDSDSIFIQQDFSNNSLMTNFYYDFANSSILTPYINVGIGVSRNYAGKYKQYMNNIEILSTKSKINYDLAWSTGIGLQTKLVNNIYADLSLKYASLGNLGDFNYSEPDGTSHFSSPGSTKTTEFSISVIYKY